jgi:hypothetical protein
VAAKFLAATGRGPAREKFRDEHFLHTRTSRTHVWEYRKHTSATVE